MTDWADEYQAAFQVANLARDPDDFRVTRQSKVTVNGLLVPLGPDDQYVLDRLFTVYRAAFVHYRDHVGKVPVGYLTATMQVTLKRAGERAKPTLIAPSLVGLDYISLDPRDYTIFTAPSVEVPVVSIHTRPERCWFLGILRFKGALGLSLGRMRVMRPTNQGMYPVTIRTKWRALTNKVKQEEVRDAYQRLIRDA